MLGISHSISTTEREIFNKRFNYENAYFYELDQRWYYIMAGPFQIKIPLELLSNNLDRTRYEYKFLRDEVELKLIEFMLREYRKEDLCFKTLCDDYLCEEIEMFTRGKHSPIDYFAVNYRKIYNYFDDWVVAITNEDNTKVERFKIQPRNRIVEQHKETIEW